MGSPTSSIRYRQHSSWDHVTTQAPPPRQIRDTIYIYNEEGKESVELCLRGCSVDKWIAMQCSVRAELHALQTCDTERLFSSRSNKRHCHVSAPFLTSLLPYYSCFHSLFLCISDFPQNSKFSLCTFLHFYLLKFLLLLPMLFLLFRFPRIIYFWRSALLFRFHSG
jgi:hypothetical protein